MDEERRLLLHNMYVEILGLPNVYYQPPDMTGLVYPCIIYSPVEPQSAYADNMAYFNFDTVNGEVITKDIRCNTHKIIAASFPGVKLTGRYDSDNMHHFTFKHTIIGGLKCQD